MILPTEVAPALCVNAYLFFGPARRMSSAKASLQIRMLRMWKSIVRRFTFATFLKFCSSVTNSGRVFCRPLVVLSPLPAFS
jgi:hypothetical protein